MALLKIAIGFIHTLRNVGQHFNFSNNSLVDLSILLEFVLVVYLHCDFAARLNVNGLSNYSVGALTQHFTKFILAHISIVKSAFKFD